MRCAEFDHDWENTYCEVCGGYTGATCNHCGEWCDGGDHMVSQEDIWCKCPAPHLPDDKIGDTCDRCNAPDARHVLFSSGAAFTLCSLCAAMMRMVEIIGPDGKVHYRRPVDHPDVREAQSTPGYTVRPFREV